MEARLYAKWLAVLCAGMATFGVGVMAIGYKAPTFGLVATVVLLLAAAVALAFKTRKR